MDRYRFSETEQAHMESSMIPFAIYQFIDKRVVTVALSKGFMKLFGYDDPARAYHDMDNDMYRDTHPDDAARIADAAFKFATEDNGYDVIYRTRIDGDSGYRIIHALGEHFYTETGERLAQVWYTDEGSYDEEAESSETMLGSSLKKALFEESFIRASYYDHLTGLPSMTYFFELAASQKSAIIEKGGSPALMFMDFSGMKYFNHKNGFSEGDKLLRAFARLLAERYGNENCCRLGQDHFAVIADSDGLEDKLKALFDECTELNGGHSLPLHVGIYQQWYDGIVASMACDRAKVACDTLKNEYSSCYSYYNMSMKDAEEKQQYIIANLDRAIEERWIKVYYQPIIRAVNGRVCDEEALARWIDPVKGLMPPADFIPILEDHRLIYKLDLHVVECVLKKIGTLSRAGLNLMPQSVNLSRSDFDCCDIVEEIRRRVDDAGISRSMLTIEITESVIGRDFEFMRTQIERFRELGFSVWMDDFGSGYSSLDLLQNIHFDLIKFDMRFMKKFSESSRSRIMLTELLRMAASLGIDTICEGVETAEQAQFLQETGCTKLQGFYFDRPIPVEKILEKYAKGIQIGFEEPAEQPYFEAIGRVNLHDLSVVAQEDLGEFDNFFNTLPMAIIEMNAEQVRFVRSNQSYRDFVERHFSFRINDRSETFRDKPEAEASTFMKMLAHSCETNEPIFMDEELPSGSVVHCCMRRIAVNPVTGTHATAVAVLSVSNKDMGTTYESIAKALAVDYFNLFYVDVADDSFYEYTSELGTQELKMTRRDSDFFSKSRVDALKYLHPEDAETFVSAFTKENVLKNLNERGVFTIVYRLILNGKPVYVNMKATRMQNDPGHIIIGVSNVDSQVRQEKTVSMIRRNINIYSKIMALSGDYICLYTADPATGDYVEYSADSSYKEFGLPQGGKDIFEKTRLNAPLVIVPADSPTVVERFTRENVLREIEKNGIFKMPYRLAKPDGEVPVVLSAILVKEDDKDKLLIGIRRIATGRPARRV